MNIKRDYLYFIYSYNYNIVNLFFIKKNFIIFIDFNIYNSLYLIIKYAFL